MHSCTGFFLDEILPSSTFYKFSSNINIITTVFVYFKLTLILRMQKPTTLWTRFPSVFSIWYYISILEFAVFLITLYPFLVSITLLPVLPIVPPFWHSILDYSTNVCFFNMHPYHICHPWYPSNEVTIYSHE